MFYKYFVKFVVFNIFLLLEVCFLNDFKFDETSNVH